MDVLCGSRCLRGAGQDARHAFRDALCHGVRSPPVRAVQNPSRARAFDKSTLLSTDIFSTSINQALPLEPGSPSPD